MKNEREHKNKWVFWYIIGSIAITAMSIMLIPTLIKKFVNKLYKYSLRNGDINFDNLGPEIVNKEKTQEEV